MSAGKLVLGVVGGFLAVVGLAVLVGGAGLLWAFSNQRNADGFFESPVAEMSTEGYAMTPSGRPARPPHGILGPPDRPIADRQDWIRLWEHRLGCRASQIQEQRC